MPDQAQTVSGGVHFPVYVTLFYSVSVNFSSLFLQINCCWLLQEESLAHFKSRKALAVPTFRVRCAYSFYCFPFPESVIKYLPQGNKYLPQGASNICRKASNICRTNKVHFVNQLFIFFSSHTKKTVPNIWLHPLHQCPDNSRFI